MQTNTQFVRSNSDKMLAGVCGGIARYFGIDSTIVRLVFVLAVLSGLTPLLYLVLWIVMPQERTVVQTVQTVQTVAPALPNHPRPVESWKFDPYTGQPIKAEDRTNY